MAGERTGEILGGMATWAEGKFRDLGLSEDRARLEGRLMLVKLEGAAMMAHATSDTAFVTDVVAEIDRSIDGLNSSLGKDAE